MGNAQGNPIRNIDKRTARREYKDVFCRSILEYQLEHGIDPSLPSRGSEQRKLNFGDDSSSNVRVLVRKRPIFQHEIDSHEFDVATCIDDRNITIHDTRMHADMRRMLLTNNNFEFDGVFNEWASNDEVYASAAQPLVKEAVSGGFATACVYGQTGSGKSFTMTSFYEKAAFDIFKELDERYGRFDTMPRVSMTFFELQGDTCLDLLNCFQSTQLLTAVNGGVHAVPCVEPSVRDANEMVELIRHALSIRTTAATGVHDSSSRSHAILRIFIEQPAVSDSYKGTEEGVLTLVDLAGSEQSIDSMYHTAERRKEGAAINSSLMALKECIRARAAGKAPTHFFRKSKLTMALKNSFVLSTARTVIVATVSPSSKDTEHSLNTLRHACLMDGQENDSGESRFVTGGVKSRTIEVGQVNVTEIARKNKALKAEGKKVEEKTSNGNTFGSELNKKEQITEKEKAKARRLADRRGISRMSSGARELLEKHRECLGCEQQQIERMRRPASTSSQNSLAPSRSDSRSSSLDRDRDSLGTGPRGELSDLPQRTAEPVYKIANTNECSSAENSPRASYEFSPRSSREFSPRGRVTSVKQSGVPAQSVLTKSTAATAESRKKATELLESRRRRKLQLQQELELLEQEEEGEKLFKLMDDASIQVDVTRRVDGGGHDSCSSSSVHEQYRTSPLPDAGLVEGSYNKSTMLANRQEQLRHKDPPPPQRKSHMSSYGGISSASGSRNAVVHETLQRREMRPVDMKVVQTRSNAPARSFPSHQAKEEALAEALKKVEKEAALKEMRRERARAVMRAKDGPSREAARAANRASAAASVLSADAAGLADSPASATNLASAASLVDREAELRSSRREQAQAIREAKEEEKRQTALKRLHSKGFSVSKGTMGSSSSSQIPESGTGAESIASAQEDAEIRRLEKQLIANRYQPEAKQYGIKKQLASLKAAKLRRERGEIDRRVSSSSGSSRPASGYEGSDIKETNLGRRLTSSAEGESRRGVARSPRGRENVQISSNEDAGLRASNDTMSPRGSPRLGPTFGRVKHSPLGASPPTSSHQQAQSLRLGAAAAPWGNSYNS